MNLIPAIVSSYDRAKRTCRISIPGLTDGADTLPEAVLMAPVGDKSEHTEARILPGDRCYVAFINGDTRYPIIMGFRSKEAGNVVMFRRWHHENIETDADQTQKHTAGTTYTVDAGTNINIEAGSSITLSAGGSTIVINSSGVTINGAQINLN